MSVLMLSLLGGTICNGKQRYTWGAQTRVREGWAHMEALRTGKGQERGRPLKTQPSWGIYPPTGSPRTRFNLEIVLFVVVVVFVLVVFIGWQLWGVWVTYMYNTSRHRDQPPKKQSWEWSERKNWEDMSTDLVVSLPELELWFRGRPSPWFHESPHPLSFTWEKCVPGSLRDSSMQGKVLLFWLLTASVPQRRT